MQFATWNVNSLNVRLPHLIDWLKAHPVQVLCIQETKTVDEKFPFSAFSELGYHVQVYGEKTYNGVAIISDEPLQAVRKGLLEDCDPFSKRLIQGVYKGINIVNVYIPNGQEVGSAKYAYKLQWLEKLHHHLKECFSPVDDLLLCGDFNIAPEDTDLFDPAGLAGTIMVSETERESLAAIKEWGRLQDAFRLHNQEAGQFSWWDYRMMAFRRNMGFRIDHIWLTECLAARCTECYIDKAERKKERPSDHAPVIATIK